MILSIYKMLTHILLGLINVLLSNKEHVYDAIIKAYAYI